MTGLARRSRRVERYEFDTGNLPEIQRLEVCEWLAAHGIDALQVAWPGWIEFVPTGNEIHYLAICNATGQVHRETDCPDRKAGRTDDACKRRAVHQLEEQPAPFPERAGRLILST